MTLALLDASDFSGRTVKQNLYNQVSNIDKYAGSTDFSISNHANAFNRKATGVEVWYYAGDAKAKEVAEKLSKAIADALGLVNRGAKPTYNLYVISNSLSHTVLIEWFFIDNANDVKKWHANKNKAIAAAIKVLQSYPSYRFRTTHGGHYGFNMMDPGAVGNNLKEAVVMQEVNKSLLNYKAVGKEDKKPVAKVNNRTRHSIYTGNFTVGSGAYKEVKKYMVSRKWHFTEEKQKDGRVRFRTGRFNQNSSSKFEFEKWLSDNNWSYTVHLMP